MQSEWRDGFGTWTTVPEADPTDGIEVTFADHDTVIGHSGHIPAPTTTGADADDLTGDWRDGFGDWVS